MKLKDPYNDERIHFFVKPVKFNKSKSTLDYYYEKFSKPVLGSKSLPIDSYTIHEEVHYFSKVIDKARECSDGFKTIIYLYDPHYCHEDILIRLRNWFLPEIHFIGVPIGANRAALLYYLDHIIHFNTEQNKEIREIEAYLSAVSKKCTSWIFTPQVKSTFLRKKKSRIYKPKKNYVYKQVEISPEGKLINHQSGPLEQLWLNLIGRKGEGQKIWAVSKGVGTHLSSADYMRDLDNTTYPINVPSVHAILANEI